MNEKLLEVLVCPSCKGGLNYQKAAKELICHREGWAFPIHDGIPVMLIGEARQLNNAEV